ncbi:MAG: hypothetical protein HF314_16945 [Ignavibacteria bacterium]|jgi:hypothetical protein|nr:hypothetical protein [Ignavibacteria bacterium]MCU7504773.1 hypothetical protein [Ignavibacteria bacterium]MCU7518358.1 hypothetical protein [Ignavibacteria bacterium]
MRIFFIFLATIFTSLSYAQDSTGSSDSLSLPEYQLLGSRFDEIRNIKDVPRSIIKELKAVAHSKEKNFMANVNGTFNSTDIVDNRYPDRRLIFAGTSDKLYFIYYECGGIGYHLSLVMFDITSGKIKPVLALTMFDKATSINNLKELIWQELPLEYYYDNPRSKSRIKKHNLKNTDFNF